MPESLSRRQFLATAGTTVAAVGLTGAIGAPLLQAAPQAPPFKISLAQWSFHKALQSKRMDNLDFAKAARSFDISAIEYVNVFFKDKATNAVYLAELNERAADHGIFQHLIMVDGEGMLGDPDPGKRTIAFANHQKWVDAAKTLGCLTLRVNADSEGPPEEQQKLCAEGLSRLTAYAAGVDLNVIVENHEGISRNADWLAGVMRLVNHPRCGTLPDFGNFGDYDKYKGTELLMPYAKGVSAKTYDFDARGEETTIDYHRMMKIVLGAGFHGYMGIEFEGDRLSEPEGITRTKELLERIKREV